jgi:hypothetical protein
VASFVLANVGAIKGKSTAFALSKERGFSSLRSDNPYFAFSGVTGEKRKQLSIVHFFIGDEK